MLLELQLLFFMCLWSRDLGTALSHLKSKKHVKTLKLHLGYQALNDRCQKLLKYRNKKHKITIYRGMATYFIPLFHCYRWTSSDWNSSRTSRIKDCILVNINWTHWPWEHGDRIMLRNYVKELDHNVLSTFWLI